MWKHQSFPTDAIVLLVNPAWDVRCSLIIVTCWINLATLLKCSNANWKSERTLTTKKRYSYKTNWHDSSVHQQLPNLFEQQLLLVLRNLTKIKENIRDNWISKWTRLSEMKKTVKGNSWVNTNTKRKQWETHSLVKWYLHLFYGLFCTNQNICQGLVFLDIFLAWKYSFDQCARGWIVTTTLTRQICYSMDLSASHTGIELAIIPFFDS
jgi:hypothetical protein